MEHLASIMVRSRVFNLWISTLGILAFLGQKKYPAGGPKVKDILEPFDGEKGCLTSRIYQFLVVSSI